MSVCDLCKGSGVFVDYGVNRRCLKCNGMRLAAPVEVGRTVKIVRLADVPEPTDSSVLLQVALDHAGETPARIFEHRIMRQHDAQTAQVYLYTD